MSERCSFPSTLAQRTQVTPLCMRYALSVADAVHSATRGDCNNAEILRRSLAERTRKQHHAWTDSARHGAVCAVARADRHFAPTLAVGSHGACCFGPQPLSLNALAASCERFRRRVHDSDGCNNAAEPETGGELVCIRRNSSWRPWGVQRQL